MAGYYGNEEATEETLRDGWLYTGDLGRIDEDGNFFIVGRFKEVIVDKNGKNVYPDELEELYDEPDLIDEFAVVGLPEGGGERVACLVVPDYEKNDELSHEELRRQDRGALSRSIQKVASLQARQDARFHRRRAAPHCNPQGQTTRRS